MDIKLNSVLYDYVRSLPPKVIDHISPSLLGGCMRRHYYEFCRVCGFNPEVFRKHLTDRLQALKQESKK